MKNVTLPILLMLLSATAMTGCSTEDKISFPSPTVVSSSYPLGESSSTPSVSPSSAGGETPIVNDMIEEYDNLRVLIESTEYESMEEYDNALKSYVDAAISTYRTETSIEDVPYTIVSLNTKIVGTADPLHIGIFPRGNAQSYTVGQAELFLEQDGEGKPSTEELPKVNCSPSSLGTEPIVLTCLFDRKLESESLLYLPIIIDEENIKMIIIPIN